MLAALVALIASSCRPYKSEIINRTGQRLMIKVYKDAQLVPNESGELSIGGNGLMFDAPSPLISIRYEYEDHQTCEMRAKEPKSTPKNAEGRFEIVLGDCHAVGVTPH